jgi:hypothetical protein
MHDRCREGSTTPRSTRHDTAIAANESLPWGQRSGRSTAATIAKRFSAVADCRPKPMRRNVRCWRKLTLQSLAHLLGQPTETCLGLRLLGYGMRRGRIGRSPRGPACQSKSSRAAGYEIGVGCHAADLIRGVIWHASGWPLIGLVRRWKETRSPNAGEYPETTQGRRKNSTTRESSSAWMTPHPVSGLKILI